MSIISLNFTNLPFLSWSHSSAHKKVVNVYLLVTIKGALDKFNIIPNFFAHSEPRGGGHSNLFSGRGVRPGFPKCGACELTFASEKGGLWAENFQIWGLVSWKFPNLGACELKISKFGGLWAKIWVKIEAVEAKISKFSQKGVLWTDSFAWNGTLASGRRGVKRGSSGPHIPIPPF